MALYGPSSLDMLATQGIIPFDAEAFVTGTPSNYLAQCGIHTPPNPQLQVLQEIKPGTTLPGQPLTDSYSPQNLVKEPKESAWHKIKTAGAVLLGTYILGVICSKGKTNPLEGIKAIYGLCASAVKRFCNIFKKP